MVIHSFPILDYEEIVKGEVAPQRILHAFETFGYFYLSGLDKVISPRLFKSIKEVSERFFASPLSAKMGYYIGDSAHHRGAPCRFVWNATFLCRRRWRERMSR
jgi:isopenicillin N synthase-like dioxygenase